MTERKLANEPEYSTESRGLREHCDLKQSHLIASFPGVLVLQRIVFWTFGIARTGGIIASSSGPFLEFHAALFLNVIGENSRRQILKDLKRP